MKKKHEQENRPEIKNKKLALEIISEYKETFTALAQYDKQEVCVFCGARKNK